MDGGDNDDGGWTVVRGKGKGKLKDGTGACSLAPSVEPAGTTDGAAAATAAGGLYSFSHTGSGPKSKRRGRGGGGGGGGGGTFRERSAEEQCAQLLGSIQSCRQEVASSPFFARLLVVLAEAAAKHLGHLPYSADGGAAAADDAAGAALCDDGGGDGSGSAGQCGGRGQGLDGSRTAQDGIRMGEATAEADSAGGGGGGGDGGGGDGGGGDGGLARWRCMRALVVYGLGSPHLSRVSRYQLALVLLLRDQVLLGLTSAVQLYDPAFDEVDRLAFQQLGLQVTEVDEGAARPVSEPTFFYMPHCEVVLYDALLRANWSGGGAAAAAAAAAGAPGLNGHGGGGGSGGLPLLAVLGNSFREYLERWEMRRAGSGGAGGGSNTGGRGGGGGGGEGGGGPAVAPGPVVRCCLEGAVSELPTPDLRFPVASAFNAMSLHTFPPSDRLDRMLREAEAGAAAEADVMDAGV
ncbi:sensitivity to red-light reduced protein [Pleodorina starrii]|uniref:Sensitivity to red-light reduced protein n=1 Tax=Pleodorina starrii TaxID=330485 RepID=A0A9W6C0I2_9CHLO|nr:sensitivity to red-light reduced protein [Pleodorina starrii]GLC60891.1 sensitivity to red-light reduced protein [Pleodorina starrii]